MELQSREGPSVSEFDISPGAERADGDGPAPGRSHLSPPERCASRTGPSRGQVLLNQALIRQLRQSRMMSQQELADDCWRRNIQLSLTTIKRAELGRAVRFRIAREFARCFEVAVTEIVRPPAH